MSTEPSAPLVGVHPSVKQAIATWTEYSEKTEILVHVTHEAFMRLQNVPEILETIYGALPGADHVGLARAQRSADFAKLESEAGFPTLHAHSLIGIWGALECFIEDLFVAMLEADASLLANPSFSKVKLPVAVVQASDRDRCRAILQEAARAVDADVAIGTTKFERLLRMVDLGGEVPEAIKEAVFKSQQIRNVWAHRSGVADERFVERCRDLGYEVGDKVNMNPAQFLRLMHGLHMYGVVIFNRVRKSIEREPLIVECVGYEGVLTSGDEGAP